MSADTFYATHAWRLISRHVRFGRALGYCEICGVPHGAIAADKETAEKAGALVTGKGQPSSICRDGLHQTLH